MQHKFEGTCSKCETAIRSNDSGATWRHLQAPEKHHVALPTGTIREI